jgi:hypothetical protein
VGDVNNPEFLRLIVTAEWEVGSEKQRRIIKVLSVKIRYLRGMINDRGRVVASSGLLSE